MGASQQADCYYFINSKPCLMGDACKFRHEPSALVTNKICIYWSTGLCRLNNCKFRHPQEHNKLAKTRQSSYSMKSHRFKPFYNGSSMKSRINPDSVYDLRTEPIAIEFEVNDDPLVRRQIKQAPVSKDRLSTKVALPKQPSELCYKADTDENIHVKTFDEIKKEREIKYQIHIAKRKHLKLRGQNNGDTSISHEESLVRPGPRVITVVQNSQRSQYLEQTTCSSDLTPYFSQPYANGCTLRPALDKNVTPNISSATPGHGLITPVRPPRISQFPRSKLASVKPEPTSERSSHLSIFHQQFQDKSENRRKVELCILDDSDSDWDSPVNIKPEPDAYDHDLPPALVSRDSDESIDEYEDEDCDMEQPPPLELHLDNDSDQLLFDQLDELNNIEH